MRSIVPAVTPAAAGLALSLHTARKSNPFRVHGAAFHNSRMPESLSLPLAWLIRLLHYSFAELDFYYFRRLCGC